MNTLNRQVSAPHGATISCKGWPQEAALRMLMNNLDPEVAERPEDLIVYGGSGRAARSWAAFDAIVATLRRLEHDETLIVQSGKPVAVFRTHPWAPRVLIANALLVPAWATWDRFRDLEDRGLTMYGQMTAGSWIYIGTQGILQGTFETLAAVGRRHFGGDLRGRLAVTAGLGGMGGAQPLAVTMNGGVALVVEVDPQRIARRLANKYVDEETADLDTALARVERWQREGTPRSIAVLGNAADVLPELVRRGVTPDIVTDQTSAHDALNGYVARGMSPGEAATLRDVNPDEYVRRSMRSMAVHVEAMLEMQRRGAVAFDYGNNIRAQAEKAGVADAFNIPGFVPEYIRPLFCEGKGPFRWAALSGDPADIATTDDLALELFAEDQALCRWIHLARERVAFQGLPARICWLGQGDRARFGLALNDLVRRGRVRAPIVIGRDHLDTGSVASPNRETEGMRDGSDAIADWPVLNALLNTSCGATWVSVHHGGGVGIGYSLHAGMVIVADGSREADEKLERVLTCDPGIGVVRHADAGYPEAIAAAARAHIDIPMGTPGGNRTMMIPERPALERRVLDALEINAGATNAQPGRIAVVLGGCGTGRTSLLLRLRDLLGRNAAQYVDIERIATTPERFLKALHESSPFPVQSPQVAGNGEHGPRDSFAAALAFLSQARGTTGGPVTFLLDEFLELRTFESFPGLRTVLRDLISALAVSPNRFVLTSRYTARAQRLLRDAPARFEILPATPLSAAEVRATLTGGIEVGPSSFKDEDEEHAREDLARLVHALSDGRPAYARMIAEAATAVGTRGAADPVSALCALLAPGAPLSAACRYCYELRLHRARGYGALKAILDVLAEQEPLTLTEIALRLRRTPGSTKDYLSWLEDVDLITSRQKRYSFSDPLLRVWVRLHCRPMPPSDEEIAREVHGYVMGRLPTTEPALALAGAPRAAAGEKSWGIIEID